jgi:hypothetical protein
MKSYYLTKKGIEEKKKKYRKKRNKYTQELRDTAKEIGTCSKCFKEKENPKWKWCKKCREYYRIYRYKRKNGNI